MTVPKLALVASCVASFTKAETLSLRSPNGKNEIKLMVEDTLQ